MVAVTNYKGVNTSLAHTERKDHIVTENRVIYH